MADKKITDTELVQLLRLNKKTGFEMLYRQYSCLIYGFILRAVASPVIAAQILSDTFITAWKQKDTYDPAKAASFTWLMNIARGLLGAYKESIANEPYEMVLYKGMDCAQAASAANKTEKEIRRDLRRALQQPNSHNL